MFGAYVLALKLNVDLSEAGSQLLAAMNTAFGSGPAAYGGDDLATPTNDVTLAFEGGIPSQFAQDRLFNGACPP